ncbi:PadR family transcriptional regulator [Modestobacter sp. KNN46-3]|uniref:PadR family transcriptional regulator n=1 Tax=Modestobacter sp. KNN46-3 TaxID=2711218 RepID=UPI0019D007FE|nr:PadR family transcriptional regulator [Modestobacter sp. KNN46-3]
MSAERWPGEWMRGVLSLCVLRVVADGPTYGYAIAARLAEAGLGPVKGGTLYPILTRLETEGLVSSSWEAGDGGPGRKFFTLTDAGEQFLRERTELWHVFTERAAGLLAPLPAARSTP